MKSLNKKEAEIEWMESQRRRVRKFRMDMERKEALQCLGSCPGEGTMRNDWYVWHGFDIDEDISIQKPKGRKLEVKHGRGCGGSMEWIATLKKQRADMNRKFAERNA